MILTCNSCEKRFVVPDQAISAKGRLVQCGSCGNKWKQFPLKKQPQKIEVNKQANTEKITPIKKLSKTKRENAHEFSNKLPEVYKWEDHEQINSDLICDYIDGKMSTYDRKEKLKKLRSNSSENTVLFSNARCLQEGVDIKNLDGIAFIDPKESFIDIIQAVGRVMRISPGK